MYKVMLVDDEKQIIEGLSKIIHWSSLNCEVVGSAFNGKMGIAQALLLEPDIIITDIRMPHVDGFEMISNIQKKLPHVRFIILTGFSEFEYAKKGMAFGVKHYVLKPVEEKELVSSVDFIIQELTIEKKRQLELAQYKELSTSGKLFKQEHLLRDLIHSGEANEDILEELQYKDLFLTYPYFTCIIAKTKSALLKPGVSTLPIQKSSGYELITFRFSPVEYAVIMTHTWKSGLNFHEAISSLHTALAKIFNCSITLGIGSTFSSLEKIGESFEEARRAIGYSMLKDRKEIIYFNQLQMSDSMVELPDETLMKINFAVEQMNPEACNKAIQDLMNFLEASTQLRQVDLRIQCLNLYLITASKMTAVQVQQLNHLVGEDILSLEVNTTLWTLDICKNWIVTLFQSIIQLKKQHQSLSHKNVIEEVIDYIQQHFSESLTLSYIAEKFYISPNYLSQLFRKKTGETFLGYLTKIRIEKAKNLLMYEEVKIYEICKQIGYEDPKYFRKIFEKMTGMNPSEYKSLYKNQNTT